MLQLLDESLEAFLRAAVPLPERDVDLVFEAPDKDWAARVSRPTVNLYLWDVRRNSQQQDGGLERVQGDDGREVLRPPLPRLDCRYLVTAWTAEVRDEHALLGAVLAALLRTPVLPEEHLEPALRAVRPWPGITIGAPEGKDAADFWSALGGQLKPGLDLVVTAPFAAAPTWTTGAVVRSRRLVLASSTSSPFAGGRDEVDWDDAGDPEDPAGPDGQVPR